MSATTLKINCVIKIYDALHLGKLIELYVGSFDLIVNIVVEGFFCFVLLLSSLRQYLHKVIRVYLLFRLKARQSFMPYGG